MVSVISGVSTKTDKLGRYLRKELNFYRIHLIFFTITPLLFSIVFYLSNGRYKVSYVDAVFNCVTSMVVCGLATVNLSELTPWQQAIMFIQMCIGSPVVISWFMVFQRRRYIRTSCSQIFIEFMLKKESEAQRKGLWRKLLCNLGIPSPTSSMMFDEEQASDKDKSPWSRTSNKVRPDMIRRMNDKPVLINPSGLVTGKTPQIKVTGATPADSTVNLAPPPLIRHRTLSSEEPNSDERGLKGHDPFPRAMTVEFASDLPRPRLRVVPTITEHSSVDNDRASRHFPTNVSLSNHPTHQTNHSSRTHHSYLSNRSRRAKHQGYGGFPMPLTIITRLFCKFFPKLERRLTRTLTIPVTTSLVSVPTKLTNEKHVPYIRETIRVGRNSQIDANSISQDQLIEIAYIEYQALGLLLWMIPLYHFGTQLLAFIVIAPYISIPKWQEDFVPPQLVRPVNLAWYSAFQVVSAYTNTGTSLVDQSLVPFQEAYPMIIFTMFLVLAGNTCFPIFFRFFVWCLSKASKKDTDMYNVLHFLLDHPRRCFIYLFPSHQTWFLLTVVILLTSIDWISFLILDLKNEALLTIPTGVRVLAGLMQSIAVRAAGFGIVPLAALAPAVKVLYVIMMYISVYPIAMSIRSTNVYEEKSLGIFHDADSQDGEEYFHHEGPRMSVWGRYLAMHARQQLAFDMWWIAISLFVLCIAEAHNIRNESYFEWFTIFNILFELVSAYGGVGLSLGVPYDNYSFSGAFRPISKLIICAVMIRGRHRGLPVAIDRAVMFPREYLNRPSLASVETDSDSDTEEGQDYGAERGRPSVRDGAVRPTSLHEPQAELELRKELEKVLTPQTEKAKDEPSPTGSNAPGPLPLAQLQTRSQGDPNKDLTSIKAWCQETSRYEDIKSPHTGLGEPSLRFADENSPTSYRRSDNSSRSVGEDRPQVE